MEQRFRDLSTGHRIVLGILLAMWPANSSAGARLRKQLGDAFPELDEVAIWNTSFSDDDDDFG